MPSTDHWETIERYLGLEPGEMVEAAGFGRRPELYREVDVDPRTTVDLSEVLRREDPIRLSASGVDLDELRERDPEAYEAIMRQARIALDRARERGERR